ncbi:YtpR family tRNA-binding protein [Lentilactobacillus sp. SPB1-3]|uniref:YtpR family tRNA-binding protein n=1 Tax=Lentilactobacillus terminaliae TaxID=3003483 RepID=A0ACD5DH80_9LACO|nr:DUF4479 and tRNA-binding domain-containing protein [Lentilactobacillus sp. SPB1-3]MCZ0977074.1 DUF4479 and tRNA-binding domain-containing protein [Lentilactobacillus sp. SPB1-3]
MLIASYNPKGTGDTLIVILRPDTKEQKQEIKNDIVRISDVESNETLGYNFFNASQILDDLEGVNGQAPLTATDVDKLNSALVAAGFTGDIEFDPEPKFVIGYVKKMEDHPDSDHLKVTITVVDGGKELQIVSGSPNMAEDIKVVVAKVGAMMPDGLIIWPGKLRGVESDGMIVSGRELRLANAPQKKGALILPNDFGEVGDTFDFDKGQHIFD